jgi:hypothetical protein
MKKLIIALAAAALITPAAFAASPSNKGTTKEGAPTSDRSPAKQATTPENQIDTTKSGQTSDRTPSNHGESGAAAGEKGTGMSGSNVSAQQLQAYEETYKTDRTQEEQLKAGGKAQ